MNTGIGHQLTGYDRKSELLAVEYEIDPVIFEKIKKIANVNPNDRDAIGSYPLSLPQLRAIGSLLGREFDNDSYAFFLEPVAA